MKNYLRSKIGPERLNNITVVSIEYDNAENIHVDQIFDKLASENARKLN